ncbi:unnamed protein product [Kuraishia capsulata CBS 1993]|uniref:Endoplasmic reticulum-Golgi intermediate compartment protein n=1 Tax=Kuraishia capsulata CBS 1993 TaxID=1382522 RepID=W6MJY8_9ASCO|nr:uncharacterized protein KUCA_T00002833001 [Kuraishia capsulata CBS 1993]CDK26859.1 unnamed protein product [Kuraishia capsulata CBS 1993]
MSSKQLLRFDLFSKTVEDSKIKTTSGGLITISCIVSVLLLLLNEFREYSKVVTLPELVIDRDSSSTMELHFDISFPNLPCDLITLDIMDISGDLQTDIMKSGFVQMRLDKEGEVLGKEQLTMNLDLDELSRTQDPNVCGSCYGALSQEDNDNKPVEERVCCNTCEAVRQAYAHTAWAFYDGANIEQCENEGYVARINERLNEGCRVIGNAEINRIAGNLHFSPGASLTQPDKHVHDLSLYDKHRDLFNFDHIINHFSFGGDLVSQAPLDGKTTHVGNKYHLFSYFVKVIGTRSESLDGRVVESNQYSSTYHDRPLKGGRDDDHPNTIHARGGIPGLFFHFDISPLKIINREQYAKTWSSFLLGACSAAGGVLTIGAVLDRTIWTADRIIRSKKDL